MERRKKRRKKKRKKRRRKRSRQSSLVFCDYQECRDRGIERWRDGERRRQQDNHQVFILLSILITWPVTWPTGWTNQEVTSIPTLEYRETHGIRLVEYWFNTETYTLRRKNMLCRTKSGSSAVPVGETFEEPFWFQVELKKSSSKGSSTGTANEPFLNPCPPAPRVCTLVKWSYSIISVVWGRMSDSVESLESRLRPKWHLFPIVQYGPCSKSCTT